MANSTAVKVPPQLPPTCAARYTVVRAIATGGIGTVWLAKHRGLDRLVALKLLHGLVNASDPLFERFVNEARVTALLDHPHVVKVVDHDLEGQRPWIAYEYLGDTTLQAMLDARGSLGLGAALAAAEQIAAALEAAHAHGIVHRDVKPDNVIAVGAGQYKLIDFGVAAFAARRGRTGINQIMGTPAYLAPEQLRCEPTTPLSDQYQLGLLVYQLISGIIPHRDANLQELLVRRMSVDPEPLSKVVPHTGPEVDALLGRMLERDPAQRFADMAAVRRAIESARAGLSNGSEMARRAFDAARMTVRTRATSPAERATPEVSRLRPSTRGRVVPISSAPSRRTKSTARHDMMKVACAATAGVLVGLMIWLTVQSGTGAFLKALALAALRR